MSSATDGVPPRKEPAIAADAKPPRGSRRVRLAGSDDRPLIVRFFFGDRAARWTSILTLVGLWQLAGTLGSRVPTPAKTFAFIGKEWGRTYMRQGEWSVINNELVRNILESLRRAAVGLLIVLLLGVVLGYAMGRWWRIQAYLTDLMMVGLALPAFIWALLAVMWFGFGFRAPVFVVVVSCVPGLVVNVFQGSIAIPRELRDMSAAYGVPFRTQFRNLVLPAISGYLLAGFRMSVLGGWGCVMLVEWFGNNQGAGYRARYWYDAQNFNGLMSWGIIILAIVIIVDRGILHRLEVAVNRWRGQVGGFSATGDKSR